MKVNVIQPWNYRVLIVDDQEEIHNDFEEMLSPAPPSRQRMNWRERSFRKPIMPFCRNLNFSMRQAGMKPANWSR